MPKPTKTKAHNPKTLLQRISNNFPDIHWSSYKYIDEGWDHEILILDQDIVFRFPNNKDYLKLLEYEGPKDQTFLKRAWAYQRWVAVYMMVNYFDTHKISFERAKETFDRVKHA